MTTVQLIVVMTFDAHPETGEAFPVNEPHQFDSPEKGIVVAHALADRHAGVIAWSRVALPDLGVYGEPEILFQAGVAGNLE